MLARTSQPDCVVLVIDSITGLDRETCALAHLSFLFGVKQIICCCNKMDATIPKYSKDRFCEILSELFCFLDMVGYEEYINPIVPISGIEGDNLIERSANIGWYKGPTLLKAIDHINEPMSPSINKNTGWENGISFETLFLQARNKRRKVLGPRLDEKQVWSIVDEIKQGITRKHAREACRAKQLAYDGGKSAKLIEGLKKENKLVDELFDNIADCLGTLIKTFRTSFLPFFEELSSSLTPMFGKDETTSEERICIFVDVAEQCHEAARKYYGLFLPFLLEACNHECSLQMFERQLLLCRV